MKEETLKFLAITFLVIILVSMISLPVWIVAADNGEGEENKDVEENEESMYKFNITLSFDEALDLAYTVRNVSYPMFQWAQQYNVSLAYKLLEKGDYFLEKAINTSSVNETKAAVYALVASVFYSRAPLAAYPVLGITIRNNRGENGTLTNETVYAVIDKVKELKSLVEQAENIAESYNITVMPITTVLVADSIAKINASIQLLNEGYIGLSLSYAVRAYHEMIKAYSTIIKAVYIEKLNLKPGHRLTEEIIIRKANKKIMEKIVEHMPKWVREKIKEKIMKGMIKDLRELRHNIRLIVENYKERLQNMTDYQISRIVVAVLMNAMAMPGMQGRAVRQWMMEHRLMNPLKLFRYIEDIVEKVRNETNTTGLLLLRNVLLDLQGTIENETGVKIDLIGVLNSMITVHIVYHFGHHRGHRG